MRSQSPLKTLVKGACIGGCGVASLLEAVCHAVRCLQRRNLRAHHNRYLRRGRTSYIALLSCVVSVGLSACYRHTVNSVATTRSSRAFTELVTVPAGTFVMGDINGEPSEYPERRVRMRAYAIERHEVTNAAYKACVKAGHCIAPPEIKNPLLGGDQYPVVAVSWLDADTYCRWVGRRLPTEAEWEYAARGSDMRKWPWKGIFDPEKANTRNTLDSYPKTAPVESFPTGVSPFGVYDMAGNVAEWTADYFDPTMYRSTPKSVENPLGPSSGRDRVVRGGSWADGPHQVRTSARDTQSPTEIDNSTGFRCAKSLDRASQN